MRPPTGKRPSLKSRCCPSTGELDKRLLRRLRHEIGPTQLREILLGLSDPDEPWRNLCHELMEQQYPTLGAKLAGKLADAYRELRYPAAKSDERDGLLAEHEMKAVRQRQRLPAYLQDCVEAGELPRTEAGLLLERHAWQQVALAAVHFLLRLKHSAGLAACRPWLVAGSEQVATGFARLLCESPQGARVVVSALAEAPASRLLAILLAVDQDKRKRLLKAAVRRVLQLSETKQQVTPDLVEAANLCLPGEQLMNWCLRWLGQFAPDDPVAILVMRCLRSGGEAVCADMIVYMQATMRLEEEMGKRDAHLRGQPGFTREAMQQVYWRQLQEDPQLHWAIHAQLHYLVSAAAEDSDAQDELLGMIARAQGAHLCDIVHVLLPALGQRLHALVARGLPLLPPEVSVVLWIEGLRAYDESVRRECITRLQALGRSALPCLLQALERTPELASAAMHVLQALPKLSLDELDRLRGVWLAAEGEAKAALSIMLAGYDPRGFAPNLRPLYRSPEAVLRGAAAYCAPIAGGAESLPGLFCLLLDPHPKVVAAARQSLIRWPDPAQLRPVLSRALRSRSAALRRQALYIVGEGQHEMLLPLVRRLADEGLVDRADLSWAEARLQDEPASWLSEPRQFNYSGFRLSVRFPHWRQYWHQVRRNMELMNAFHQANLFGAISDVLYLQMREEMKRGRPGSGALYRDLVYDLFADARNHFERYHGYPLSPEQWDQATRRAWRTVDEPYLQEQWERGEPRLAINHEATAQWETALWWEIETQLLKMLPEDHQERQPPGCPGREWGSPIEREWHWLSQFPNWRWGFTVRPRVPVASLVAFVQRKWRNVTDAPDTFTAQVVREILDYCALWGHAFPGNRAWRRELCEALWACHLPLRRAILRREPRGRTVAHGSAEAKPEDALDYHFAQVLAEWNPFFGSPVEPLLPIGLLGARVGTKPLPPHIYGRGVPFTHFLKRRLDKLLGDTRGYEVLQPSPDKTVKGNTSETDDDSGDASDLEVSVSATSKERWSRFIVTDDEGHRWLRLHGLAEKTGVPYRQLLRERDRGFLCPERYRRRLVVPDDDNLDTLCYELKCRAMLRRVSRLARELNLTPAQTGRLKAILSPTRTAAETIQEMGRLTSR